MKDCCAKHADNAKDRNCQLCPRRKQRNVPEHDTEAQACCQRLEGQLRGRVPRKMLPRQHGARAITRPGIPTD